MTKTSARYSPEVRTRAVRMERNAILERDKRLARFVRDRLTEGWSPQQIAGWLQSGAELGLRAIAMETIYAFLYRAGQKAEQLWRYLARRHKRRPIQLQQCFEGWQQGVLREWTAGLDRDRALHVGINNIVAL